MVLNTSTKLSRVCQARGLPHRDNLRRSCSGDFLSFLSYFIMFGGLFLVRPSFIMMVLVIATIAIFHGMVLKEEAHLSRVHGQAYEAYKKATGRYLPRR